MTRTRVVPGLLLAVGIVGSTALAMATENAGMLVVFAPAVLAAFAVVAGVMAGRGADSDPRGRLGASLIVGAAVLLAGLLTALGDASAVSTLMPILGAGVAAPVVIGPGRRRDRCFRRS
ncbi:MAG: hypothetical protein PVF68_14670 [Acidobacteriota bacterium]|jgi:hypothetical protein